jgi:DNA-binding NtrC family response regulator
MHDTITCTDDAPAEPGTRTVAYLVVALDCDRPELRPRRVCLDRLRRVVIGRADGRDRDADADAVNGPDATRWVTLPHRQLSARHAELTRQPHGWILEDARSKNGTWVNGRPIRQRRLQDGDLIAMGNVLLMYREQTVPDAADVQDAKPAGGALTTLHPALEHALDELRAVVASPIPVLIRGDTGVGKELVARAVHELSGRRGNFIAVNCGALPDTLIASQLFGHRRGAFSGASEDRTGFVRAASGGTLFLDEIAELGESSQVALLRVLQEREVVPLGATRPVRVDLRVIAATHQNLAARVATGRFRADLLARLTGFEIALPELRARREDLGALIACFMRELTPPGAPMVALRRSAGHALFAYSWPSNIRELRHVIAVAMALARGGDIQPAHLPERVRTGRPAPIPGMASAGPSQACYFKDDLERLMVKHQGCISEVAREMGKARQQIMRWNRKLGIDPAAYRPGVVVSAPSALEEGFAAHQSR